MRVASLPMAPHCAGVGSFVMPMFLVSLRPSLWYMDPSIFLCLQGLGTAASSALGALARVTSRSP
jgi:hypothetical protein